MVVNILQVPRDPCAVFNAFPVFVTASILSVGVWSGLNDD